MVCDMDRSGTDHFMNVVQCIESSDNVSSTGPSSPRRASQDLPIDGAVVPPRAMMAAASFFSPVAAPGDGAPLSMYSEENADDSGKDMATVFHKSVSHSSGDTVVGSNSPGTNCEY